MNTYIVKIETLNGTQQTLITAPSMQNAKAQIEARTRIGGEAPLQYSIQQHHPALATDVASALFDASGALFACLLVLVIAVSQIRSHFKGQ